MPLDHPLVFRSLFRRYLWGGRRLATLLHKELGEGNDYAESWEVVDHGADQSIVAEGPFAGRSLHELVEREGPALFGRHLPQAQFPLLFKFLDANQPLSIQVHPDDAYAQRMTPPDRGKTEAWVVMHAEPGSVLYAGLKRGFNRQALEREVRLGTTQLCLNEIEPQAGDCIFIPAGVPHALGADLVIAEIQQASDTTFRLFDWNRVGADGRPRTLHIEQALEVIDYDFGPVAPQQPQPTDDANVERLVACDKFVLDRRRVSGGATVAADERFHLLAVLQGEVVLQGRGGEFRRQIGQTALVPAAALPLQLESVGGEEAVLLDMYLP